MLDQNLFRKILETLSEEEIPFVIVGGTALVLHGIPRSTMDVDMFVDYQEDVICKLLNIESKLGLEIEQKHMLEQPILFPFLVGQWISFKKDDQYVLDICLVEHKEFDSVFKRSKCAGKDQIRVNVASLEDLLKMKEDVGREIDKADIALIQEFLKRDKNDDSDSE